VKVVQVGSLCPTGFDDASQRHGLVLWDGAEVTFVDVPGPRFATVRSEEELTVARARLPAGCRLFVSWVASGPALDAAAQRCEADLPAGSWEVVPDERASKERAALASAAARSAKGLAAAVDAFVASMPNSQGVDRARVLERARSYLKL
jgi:hypothetical protein